MPPEKSSPARTGTRKHLLWICALHPIHAPSSIINCPCSLPFSVTYSQQSLASPHPPFPPSPWRLPLHYYLTTPVAVPLPGSIFISPKLSRVSSTCSWTTSSVLHHSLRLHFPPWGDQFECLPSRELAIFINLTKPFIEIQRNYGSFGCIWNW